MESTPETVLQVSKLDAARRQTDTAISLYFNERDPVSIHALTAAAYRILQDLSRQRGEAPMFMKEEMLEHVRDEFRAEFRAKLNEAENFFKHADRDPDALLLFNPGLSELMLYECCIRYWQMTGETTPHMHAYKAWFMLKKPRFFILPPQAQAFVSSARLEFASCTRQQFLQEAILAANRFVDGPT